MKAKKNVKLEGCCFEIGYAAGICEGIFNAKGKELVVTSAKDSTHSENSLHYSGKAIDIRTNSLTIAQGAEIFNLIKVKLEPQGFDCVDEKNHWHIEFQPKQGEKFIEVVA